MSKRALVKYLQSLSKEELENQVLDLYTRFKPVKTYFDFVFHPKEDRLIEEAKFKINKEYFPAKGKVKARRSVAQKIIKHFLTLELKAEGTADVMLFHLETALAYNKVKPSKQDAFYTSMLRSFEQAVQFTEANGLTHVFNQRMADIVEEVWSQEWFNAIAFEQMYDSFLVPLKVN